MTARIANGGTNSVDFPGPIRGTQPLILTSDKKASARVTGVIETVVTTAGKVQLSLSGNLADGLGEIRVEGSSVVSPKTGMRGLGDVVVDGALRAGIPNPSYQGTSS